MLQNFFLETTERSHWINEIQRSQGLATNAQIHPLSNHFFAFDFFTVKNNEANIALIEKVRWSRAANTNNSNMSKMFSL